MSQNYQARRWPVIVIGAVLVFGIITIVMLLNQHPEPLQKLLEPQPTVVSTPSVSTQTMPKTPPTKPKKKTPKIPDAVATALWVPGVGIDAKVYPLQGCQQIIEPPLTGATAGSVFNCVDFDLPGSRTKDIAVLAGHSSLKIETVFNSLYLRGGDLVNREVWVKTELSGNRWLVYKIYEVHTPLKEELPYMTDVWGAPGETEPGKLVLVTCLWDEYNQAPNNFIALAQFERIARR